MESSNTTPLLRCDQVRQFLEEKSSGSDREALRLHLKTCADCRAELRLRVVMAQMMEEPPADLTDCVMNRIRAEQKKTAARLRLIRRIGAAAAAVVLIPAVVILAPILLRTGHTASTEQIAREEETRIQAADIVEPTALPETTAAAAEILYSTFSDEVPDGDSPKSESAEHESFQYSSSGDENTMMMAPAAAAQKNSAAPETTPETIPETAAAAETVPVSAAPSYVGQREPSHTDRQTSPSTMASEISAATPQGEAPVYAVLRALVGEKVLSAHIAAFSGSDADLPAYLCRIFSVTREAFLEQANNMALSFTEEELDLLFAAEQ